MPPNLLAYKLKDLRKVNSQRRALSGSTIVDVPVLTTGEMLYIGEGQMQGGPATCYRCPFYNYGRSCQFMGPHVEVRKFVYPPAPTEDSKSIEYWPCCGMFIPGKPNYGPEKFFDTVMSPDQLDLGWINAPRIGQAVGGANCGGKWGGDDCDHYITKGDDKRAEPTAFCRVKQGTVENGGVCAVWGDDDWIDSGRGAMLLKELRDGGK